MARWSPDAGARLAHAALELFTEQGFAATTVPQITARAGLTTRTFFRHFADKREVLFAGEEELPDLVAQMMADAPPGLSPIALIDQGLQAVAASRFEGRRTELQVRRAVVRADAGLRERELRKSAVLVEAIERGFLRRGVDELTAKVAAHLASTTLTVAVERWLDAEADQPLAQVVQEALVALRAVTAP